MDAATYKTVAAVVEKLARMFGSRWSLISVADFRQEGWALALEALHRHDADRGELGGYLWSALSRDLLCYAYRTIQPVKTHRTREYKHAYVLPASDPCWHLHNAVDPYPNVDDAYATRQTVEIVRDAVEAVADEPAIAEYLLEGKTQRKLTAEYGGSVNAWSWKCRKAREAIRSELKARIR